MSTTIRRRMLFCDAPVLDRWRPDFSSSGQDSPELTRAVCEGATLANQLERVDWDADRTQVLLCEECGIDECADGGYVRALRLGDWVLWTAPRLPGADPDFEAERYAAHPLVERHGAVAIPAAAWATWPGVPALRALPEARRADLAAAWRAPAPPREEALASDAGSLDEAFATVAVAERWFASERPVGVLGPMGEHAVTIFYEHGRFTEWVPAAWVQDRVVPVFGGRLAATPHTG